MYLDKPNEQYETKHPKEEVKESTDDRPVYFLSLVGTDANEAWGRGIPRDAYYWYDIKTKMELERYGIQCMSAQDLKSYHDEQMASPTSELNIYQLVQFFMEKRPDGYYFLDEVPLIAGGMKSPVIYLLRNNFNCTLLF